MRTAAESALAAVACPRCDARLDLRAPALFCSRCGRSYPRLGSVPVLLPEPDRFLDIIRDQLRVLDEQIEQTTAALESQARAGDVLPLTRARCQALRDASRQQRSELAALLLPLLPQLPAAGEGAPSSHGNVPSLLTNIHYLFRDWGWPAAPDDENARTYAAVSRVLGGRPLGSMLVLGAGACRLAYDLHRHGGATETIAVDIDPILLAVADVVVRGGTVQVTEGYADMNELARPATRWNLQAPAALSDDRFHLMLADGLDPPIAAHTFDTVVTPWFIDAIPSDLREAIGVVSRMLRPAGRWASIGPLRYAPDVPVVRRFTREEVFELAARAGLAIQAWEAGTCASLVSSQTGRGKLEWVLTFCAVEGAGAREGFRGSGPPSWLVFGHLPIPTFAGQQLLASANPLVRFVVSAIDGQRTLDDVTAVVVSQIAGRGVSKRQVRETVRQCVAEIHPACRT